jgi:photosystem II stability/assembly factor-like uncharacterized protein
MKHTRTSILLLLLVCFSLSAPQAKKGQQEQAADDSRMSAKTFKGLALRGIGPALMAGRIADIAIHPQQQNTWYVAVGSGGVWKTTNAGTIWTPIFEDQGSYSIGCVTIDPTHPETIWVGTGENVGGRHVGYGDGIYRSRDGGANWTNMGLTESEHISRIIVDPRDSNVVLVAVEGPLWSAGGERGLYRTADGGETWTKVLGGGEFTGVNDVVADPINPDVLYASTHQRLRTVAALINGGPESAIHKSVDGGLSWRQLEKGLPEDDMGKIGLAISPQHPEVVYATIELAHRKGGFYRSANGGESWEKRNDYISGATGPHYYQEIFASPHAFDRVYQMDNTARVTQDGGKTFKPVGEQDKHVDNHALAFNPQDPDYLLAGCDGGLYESWDQGKTWKFIANLPLTQFYKVAVDYDEPFYNVYGGTQDNNTQGGPSRTDNINGIRNSDWKVVLFADGHQPAVDPTNPDIIYAEWQQGNLVRHDRKTGENVYIRPQPAEGEEYDRFNWDTPILISPHDPARLYYASQRIFRSDDRGDSWRTISGDLSRDQDRLTMPMMDRVWSIDAVWDVLAMSKFGNITSLSESPLEDGLLYAGTDDGLIQVSEDGGAAWRRIDQLPGVADHFFVNDIKADLHDVDTVYVVVDHHKDGDFAPYLFKSTDRGVSWKSIASDLPERQILWRLVQDHVEPNLLFVGAEYGLFFSVDGGGHWIKLGGGAPNIPFRDLVIQRRENDVVAATFGRGFYILDDYSALRGMTEAVLEREAELFSVRDAWWYIQRRPLGQSKKASQGGAFFIAPNPPFGAVFTYHLKEALQTRKQVRQATEKEIAGEGADTPYPGWEELLKEDREEDPAIILTVRDSSGDVVRRLSGPVKAGFHRVAWDLRYPANAPWKPKADDAKKNEGNADGSFLAAPGNYSVSLAKRVDGVLTELSESQSFAVKPLRKGTLPGSSPAAVVEFTQKLSALQRAILGATRTIDETSKRLVAIRETLLRSTSGDTVMDDETRALEQRLAALRLRLQGSRRRSRTGDPGLVSINARMAVAELGTRNTTYGPTATHLMSYELSFKDFTALREELAQLVETDLKALETKLDAAGLPWTPGRLLPVK